MSEQMTNDSLWMASEGRDHPNQCGLTAAEEEAQEQARELEISIKFDDLVGFKDMFAVYVDDVLADLDREELREMVLSVDAAESALSREANGHNASRYVEKSSEFGIWITSHIMREFQKVAVRLAEDEM